MTKKNPASALNDLPGLSIRRPYLAIVLNLLIMIAGFGAVFGIEVRELPDIDRPIVSVYAQYPGASPETLDAEVTSVIEAAVSRVNGVKEVRSSSEENNLRIRVVFNSDVALSDAASDVREAVSRVERQLPAEVENITVIKADADASSIVSLAVSSERHPVDQLTRIIEDQIIPELTSVEGVADVSLFGEQERVLRVDVDPIRLAGYGLSLADIADVLERARFDVPAGSFKSGEQEILVRANASVFEPEKIADLYVRHPVRIGDVADVYFAPDEAESWVRLNGRQVVSLGIIRQASSNTIAIADGVDQAVQRLSKALPQIKIEKISDDSLFIKSAIAELLSTLGLTILIVVSVILLFTAQVRASFIPTFAIPVALVGALSAVWMLGFSLNLITLLALVLATGVVVDDAIVVLENIQRLRAKGLGSKAAAVLGTRQVFFAVIATSATLISVFVPISFLPSEAGRLFQEFGFVLAIAIAISSFVALTLVPVMVAALPKREGPVELGPRQKRVDLALKAQDFYEKVLDHALLRPLHVFIAGAVFMALAGAVYLSLDQELVPREDRGKVTVRLTGPDGVGLEYTDRQVEKVEAAFQPFIDQGVIENLYTITGRWDLNRGQIDAPLIDWEKRDISEGEIAQAINEYLSELPGAQGRVRPGNSLNLRNADGGLEIALIGSNYQHIFEQSQKFVRALEERAPWISNLRIEFRATQPELSLGVDRDRAVDLGVDLDDLARTIQVLIDELDVGDLVVNDQMVPILLQARPGAVREPGDIANLYVIGEGGRLVPLSQLVSFSETSVAAELDRHAQRRAIEIDGDVALGKTLYDAIELVRETALEVLEGDVGVIFLGEAKALEETTSDMAMIYIIALVVVFLVLVAQFESIISALVVMLTVPLGMCAAVFALKLTGTSINIYSQIGVLMLIGIMAKNAILMVEFADQLRETGASVLDAAKKASMVRLRPIMMTMVSTVCAGIPLVLASGAGVEARTSIGWVIFGGLGLAGIMTLIVTPVLYSLLGRFSKPRSHSGQVLQKELEKVSVEELS